MASDEMLQRSRRLTLEQAALLGTEGSARPLERGEDLESSDLAEADHWAAVYHELADFSRELLTEMVGRVSDSPGKPSGEMSRARLALEIELKLYELHLGYWRQRSEQLRGASGGT